MASVAKKLIFSGSISGTTTTEPVSLEPYQIDWITTTNTIDLPPSTTLTCTIERSPDGINWFSWATQTIVGPGSNPISTPNTPGLSYVRAIYTFSGSGSTATIETYANYDIRC